METLLIISLVASITLTLLLIREKRKEVTVQYLPEIDAYQGLFKKQKTVRIKAQILLGGLPLGPAFTVSEQKTVEIDDKRIHDLTKVQAEPMLKAGVKAVLLA